MITFNKLTTSDSDMKLLFAWLNNTHVKETWGRVPISLEETRIKYKKKIESTNIFPYIIHIGKKPIGYIQSYYAPDVGQGWWQNEPDGTWGIDMFIGEEQELGKGLGSKAAEAFADKLFEMEKAKRVIVDPKPDNSKAIRAYEKAGFIEVGEIDTPNGVAMLMEKKCPKTRM